MKFDLPSLPYAIDALEPHLSAETLEFHHGKHHQTYMTALEKLLAGTPQADQSLEQIVLGAKGAVFDNAAQVWNHTFYWNCMTARGGGEPGGPLSAAIKRDFGGFAQFKAAFTQAALGQFGSGWAWLVKDADGSLKVTKTSNADLPLRHGQTALLTCDVWEHAYYIDYRNARARYVETFLNSLANWDFTARMFA
jgi:Fe-Mn family superoxide dismutase